MPDSPQPWIASARVDGWGILAPPFIATALVALAPPAWRETELSPAIWLLLVVGIDAAHVYSTLFRTYLHPSGRERFSVHLWAIPLAAYVLGVMLYRAGPMVFWRTLAYVAVFHFVRQQYGFMRIYTRYERSRARWSQYLDSVVIYGATLVPLLCWHLSGERHFVWFVPGDFWLHTAPSVLPWVLGAWWLLVAVYVLREAITFIQIKYVNLPKQLLLLGTIVSWFLGIVVWNSDLAFTVTNVIAHGVPYVVLVWWRNRSEVPTSLPTAVGYAPPEWMQSLIIIVVTCVGFALLEESLWAGVVWREHFEVLPWAKRLPAVGASWQRVLVPLLVLPQLTHYVLDGFIWRRARAA